MSVCFNDELRNRKFLFLILAKKNPKAIFALGFGTYTFGPASTTSGGVLSVNLAKFSLKRIAKSR